MAECVDAFGDTVSISAAFAEHPRPVAVRAAALTTGPSLAGARIDALDRLRAQIVAGARRPG